MRHLSLIGYLLLTPLLAAAAEMDISVEIPALKVAEYHRPYVAVWVETPDNQVAANLGIWYDLHNAKGEGESWLKDLRQWWRRAGRDMSMPVDGITGATRPVGQHRLHFVDGEPPLGRLSPGTYILMVEAAREVGGREVLRLPFDWPGTTSQHQMIHGESELGQITLDINP